MIDVLTTVRNGMPFLEESVVCVKDQQSPHFRHIVVDDGSNDGSVPFLRKPENAHVELILSPPIGRGRALNLAWQRGTGGLVAILDADDVASPCWLSEMAEMMMANPNIAVLSCRGVLDFNDLEVHPGSRDSLQRLEPASFLDRNPVHHSGTLIRRSALVAAEGYDESRQSLFDYALWIRLLQLGLQIWHVDRGYIFKRIHDRQHFEARRRIQYLCGCFHLRREVSGGLLKGKGALVPYLTFVYGLLPQELRHWLRYRRYRARASGRLR